MTKLETCACGQLAVVYNLSRKEWLCKVCEAILKAESRERAPGFILRGSGWPGKDIKGGNNA